MYPYWKLSLTAHTYDSDKKLGTIISQNSKTIDVFYKILFKPPCNYTTTEKELLIIVECLKKSQGIIFDYKINVLSDHKNMVYAATLSESQRVMRWGLIIEEFGPNIQHISEVDNILADTLSRLLSTPSDTYKPCTGKAQCRSKKLFTIGRVKKNEDCFPLNHLILQREQQKELSNVNSNLIRYILDQGSGYSMQKLDDVEIICYNSKI